MARLTGGGLGWLHRLWRRAAEESASRPGNPAVLAVEQALGALEAGLCEGMVRRAGEPVTAAAARRVELPGAPPRNLFGRPVQEEASAAPEDAVAVATGMALAGLRATVFLSGDELWSCSEALRSCADRLTPLVLHAAGGAGGHGGYHAVAGSGHFQAMAGSGQEALDLALVARWVAERSLLPGLVATDCASVESLALPAEETIRAYLGHPDQPIDSPTEAQRLLFGHQRPRLLQWFDPDRPVATGGLREAQEASRARLAGRHFFWEPVAELARQGMEELSGITGRPLSFATPYQLEDAEVVLVGQGAVARAARAMADHLRRTRRCKVGVLGITWLRPFPAGEVAEALAGHRAVAVLEAMGDAPAAGTPLYREVAEAAGRPDGWISATCAGVAPSPETLAGLCELLRRPERPQRVELERLAAPGPGGFPRRDALVQSVAHAYPALGDPTLPSVDPPAADPEGGVAVGLVGREDELPPDALTLTAQLLADEVGAFVRGSASRPAPGVWEARVRAAESDFADPGPRARVSVLLVAANDLRSLGHPLRAVAPGGAALVASEHPAERLWAALPPAWRRSVREGELRLLAVGEGFQSGLEALRACLSGEPMFQPGGAREVGWKQLADPDHGDRALPRMVARVSRARQAHDSLPRFWGEVAQPRQGDAPDGFPDPVSAAGAVPAAASALAPQVAASSLPELDPGACTGCGRCWSVCPDSALGATALGTEALFTAASRLAGTEGKAADALRRAHKHLAGRLAGQLPKGDSAALEAQLCRDSWDWVAGRLNLSEHERPEYDEAFSATLEVVEELRPIATQSFFGEPEQAKKDAGELLVLVVDPRACTGCGLCVTSCPEDALQPVERTSERSDLFERRWRAWEGLPDTSGETLARAAKRAEPGPLAAVLLSRHCAQAQVGGVSGEPGSGERLAGRLAAALVEHHAQRRTAGLVQSMEEQRATLERKVRELLAEGLSATDLDTLQEALAGASRGRADLSELGERLEALGSRATFDRRAVLRMTRAASELDDDRRRLAEGEDGLGRARFGVVVARGTTAEWAARFPGHPYYAPLTLAPTAEGAELARGLACGLVAEHLSLLRSLRRAALEAEAPPDRPARLEAIRALSWDDLGAEERAGCPPLLLLADDGALLEQGFESLTRLLASELPVKVILLDGRGRLDGGPEPSLVAMAHRKAFVLATSLAHPEHLAGGVADALAWPGPALIHLHAPSPRRHGFPADATLERARLAVESRAHVLLRYDPGADGVFGLRASLEGNPELEGDWGETNFAQWAAGEERFGEHFEPLEEGDGLPLVEWLALPEGGRAGRVPAVEIEGKRLAVSQELARTAAERLALWKTLQELTGGASPFTQAIREALARELEAEQQARLNAQRAEHEAQIAETRASANREAMEKLVARLMTLSGFDPTRTSKGSGA
jgi:pyruvate-ferredoxin/flavodoxin oxidoreductase